MHRHHAQDIAHVAATLLAGHSEPLHAVQSPGNRKTAVDGALSLLDEVHAAIAAIDAAEAAAEAARVATDEPPAA